jgi:DNA (cytosine-5)-methyltransferase 1
LIQIAERLRPTWVVWENVPGVLSSGGGRDFGAFVGALFECGYEYAWRVLDAQYFGVPQRRRRVFVVGSSRAGGAASVLFDGEGVFGDLAEGRSPGKGAAGVAASAARSGSGEGLKIARESGQGFWMEDSVTGTLDAHMGMSGQKARPAIIAPSLVGPSGGSSQSGGFRTTDLDNVGSFNAVAFKASHFTRGKDGKPSDIVPPLTKEADRGDQECLLAGEAVGGVRRLTPLECERLQGFPDGWTAITMRGKPAADSPRYKAIGNSMAVPVMHWVGSRIAALSGCGE